MALPLTIHLLCMDDKFKTAFNDAQREYNLPSSINVTIHNKSLNSLPRDTLQFDAIVSPANSFARLDGGFDDALSRAFAPENDYHALTRVSQATLWEEWRGFAPPGSCTLVDLDDPQLKPVGEEAWNCRYMALCPTMKIPQNVNWDCDVVYECIWSLLVAIDKHNTRLGRGTDGTKNVKERAIHSILMTPIATGVGFWSPERWAAQAVIAMKHFAAALERGAGNEGPKGRSWGDIHKLYDEMGKTHNRQEKESTVEFSLQSQPPRWSAKLLALFGILVMVLGSFNRLFGLLACGLALLSPLALRSAVFNPLAWFLGLLLGTSAGLLFVSWINELMRNGF